MVKKVTRWTADTCGCVLEYEWDDDGNDAIDKEHTFHAAPHVCGGHLAVEAKAERGKEKVYQVVKDENTRKNKVLQELIDVSDDVGEEVVDPKSGERVRRMKDSIDFEYKFTGADAGNRVLEIEFKTKPRAGKPVREKVNLKQVDKDKIESELGTKLGIDRSKVVIK